MPKKLSRAAADGPIRTGRSEQRADNVHNGRTVNRIVLPQKRERVQRAIRRTGRASARPSTAAANRRAELLDKTVIPAMLADCRAGRNPSMLPVGGRIP